MNTLVHARRPARSQGGAAAVVPARRMARQPATTGIDPPSQPLRTRAPALLLARMSMAASGIGRWPGGVWPLLRRNE